MTNAEHILIWCENSQPHWRKLMNLQPGNFIRASGHASAAFNLALSTANDMIAAGDLSRMSLEASDILDAAKLMLEWRAE